jgi:hypothetical protein
MWRELNIIREFRTHGLVGGAPALTSAGSLNRHTRDGYAPPCLHIETDQ